MLTLRGHDVLAPPYRQQVIFRHDPHHAFVVHPPSLVLQVPGDPAIPVTAPVCNRDLLDPSPQGGGCHLRFPLLPAAIVTGAADPSQMTHRLDPEVSLCLLYASDFFVDAVSPQPSLARRRASILRKTPCKKSTSNAFLPSAARSC